MAIEIPIENALCFNLYSASRAMTQVYRPYLKKVNLTYPQFLVMLILWQKKNDAVTVKSLGERLYLDSGTLTPLLKRLESMNLINRERSPRDEREVLIKLATKGKELERKCEKIPMEMFCNLNVDEKRFVEIRDGVSEILHNLQTRLKTSK